MPRQLPWLNKGAGSRTQLKQTSKLKVNSKAQSDIDDDFFDGTVLAGSSKGKAKALRSDDDSDDDLPELPAEPSTPRTKSRNQDALRKRRTQSSSPPPIQDYAQPETEYMLKGASKFDLLDDEWMMVEDEFLETAKLFTRHLHIAEYKKLKERIEAKKQEEVEAVRPVVVGGKMSVEGAVKLKAEVQEKKQRKAFRDVFASQNDEDEDDEAKTTSPMNARKATSSFTSRPVPSTLKRPTKPLEAHDTNDDADSDDLDAKHPTFKRTIASKPKPTSALSTPAGPKSALPATSETQASASIFNKPALPTARLRATERKGRISRFDSFDDYVPRAKVAAAAGGSETPRRQPAASSMRSSTPASKSPSPTKVATPAEEKTRRTVDIADEFTSGLSKETAARIAKRKAEREKEREARKKGFKLDDVPTFLV